MQAVQRLSAVMPPSLQSFLAWVAARRQVLWLTSIFGTAACRLLASAHWVTDTMAGGALGLAVLGAALLACKAFDMVVVRQGEL
jgi:hypothetical protein